MIALCSGVAACLPLSERGDVPEDPAEAGDLSEGRDQPRGRDGEAVHRGAAGEREDKPVRCEEQEVDQNYPLLDWSHHQGRTVGPQCSLKGRTGSAGYETRWRNCPELPTKKSSRSLHHPCFV